MLLRRVEDVLDLVPDACLIVGGRGVITAANLEAHRLFGWDPGALVGQVVAVLLDPADRPAHGAHLERYARAPERRYMGGYRAVRALRRDGSRFYADIALNPVRVGEEGLTAVSVRDVSALVAARKLAEDAHREVEALLDMARVGTWSRDLRTGVRTYSATLIEMMQRGPEELTEQAIYAAVHPDDVARARGAITRCVDEGVPYRMDVRFRLKDGSWGVFQAMGGVQRDLDGAPVAIGGFVRDRTVEQGVHDQLVLGDRLNHVGLLAATVVHEVNNPLSAALLNVDVVRRQLRVLTLADPAAIQPVDLAEALDAAADAAAAIEAVAQRMQDLRALGRGDLDTPVPVDLAATTQANLRLVWRRLAERARVTERIAPTPVVPGTPARVGQLVLNLLLNAAASLPAGAAGENEVLVETSSTPSHVRLVVADTGHGMTPEVVARLFTPFFTTRAQTGGTGLGMFVCHQIVTGMGGTIRVDSEPGAGTTITVELPR